MKKYILPMHRVIMGLKRDDTREVDHIDNTKTLDNRRSNLRIVTHLQNSWNSKVRSHSRSGIKGAFLDVRTGKFYSRITVNKVRIKLGVFNTAEEAHQAYADAAALYFGEYARLS